MSCHHYQHHVCIFFFSFFTTFLHLNVNVVAIQILSSILPFHLRISKTRRKFAFFSVKFGGLLEWWYNGGFSISVENCFHVIRFKYMNHSPGPYVLTHNRPVLFVQFSESILVLRNFVNACALDFHKFLIIEQTTKHLLWLCFRKSF